SLLRPGARQDDRRVARLDPVRLRHHRGAVVAGRPRRAPHGPRVIRAALLALVLASPAAAHHVGAYVPKDNAVTTNFKQVKFSVQAKKFDVALQLYEAGALRTEMRAHAATLPAGLEDGTRAALKAGDGPEVERRLMIFFAALARDLALEADRQIARADATADTRVAIGRKFLEAIWRYYNLVDFAVASRGNKASVALRLAFDEAETYVKPATGGAAPAERKAEKLILQDDVKLLVGAVSSGATLAVMDVTKKHKTIHWNSVSCAEFMRTTKFHKYYFSNQPDSRMQANGLAKYIVDKMGKKVYIFYTDYAMGQSDGRQFKTALEKIGGEIVGVAGAPLDTKDFSPWFGAINQANPDVLFLAFAGTDSLRLMTQLHSFGMTKKYKLAGIDCFLLQQDLPAIAEPMEGFVQLAHYSAYNPDKQMAAFNERFKKKFGVDGNIMAGAYDGVLFWAAAAEKAKTFDADKVEAALEGMCVDN